MKGHDKGHFDLGKAGNETICLVLNQRLRQTQAPIIPYKDVVVELVETTITKINCEES